MRYWTFVIRQVLYSETMSGYYIVAAILVGMMVIQPARPAFLLAVAAFVAVAAATHGLNYGLSEDAKIDYQRALRGEPPVVDEELTETSV